MSNNLKKASTIEELFFLFDPRHDLREEDELQQFYVDRKSGIRNDIRLYLKNDSLHKMPVHMLFTGHKGSGKSTEVNKLCSELDGEFFIVKVSFKNRPDVDYIDVLLKAAMSLFKTATDEAIIKKYIGHKVEDLLNELYLFVHHTIYGDIDFSKNLELATSASAKINLLAVEFEAKFEAEPQSRKAFKDHIEKILSELIDKINMMSERIREDTHRPVLFIFEEADKIDLKNAEEIFYKHSNTLVNIRASAIYIIDVSLRYNTDFAITKASFSNCYCLPNIKLVARNNEPVTENAFLLEKIIDNRVEGDFFEVDAKEKLIQSSGGLIRTLIVLIQSAAATAHIANSPKITVSHVEYAISRQKGDFIGMLKSKDYPVLANLHRTKALSSDEENQNLLQSTALLEYDNGELWCDVHPIILPEVLKRAP